MAKMKLSLITIEGMHNVDRKVYQLGNFNYLHGLNGAGKTTVMQAIQLALLGYIPGTDKRKEAIFKHACAPEMRVTLNIEDGGQGIQIIRSWTRTSKDIVTHVMVTPAGYDIENIMQGLELPVCNFNEFVGMTANKLKDWFMWFLPAADDVIVWDKTLNDAIIDYGRILDPDFVKEVCEYTKDLPQGLEGIRQLNEHLKSLLSFKKGEASRVQSTVQSLVFYDDCDGGLDTTKLQTEISSANVGLDELKRARLIASQNAQTHRDIANLNLASTSLESDRHYKSKIARLDELSGEHLDLPDTAELSTEISRLEQVKSDKIAELGNTRTSELDALNDAKMKKTAELSAKKVTLSERRKVVEGNGICPYTNGQCAEISTLVNRYISEIATLESDIKLLEEALKSLDEQLISIKDKYNDGVKCVEGEFNGKITELRTKINTITDTFTKDKRNRESEVTQLNQDIRTLENGYARLSSLQSKLVGDIPETPDDEFATKIADMTALIASKQDLITKIEANKRYNELTETLTKQKYQIEQDMEILKDWIKLTDVNGLQSTVMDKPFENLADTMSEYLKVLFDDSSIRAKFLLSGKSNSFSFGLFRDNIYLPFDQLSGGEKCLYTLALLISIVDADDINMPLVLVDDLLDHLDRPKIDTLFNALYVLEGVQIIIAGVQECRHTNADKFVIEVSR